MKRGEEKGMEWAVSFLIGELLLSVGIGMSSPSL